MPINRKSKKSKTLKINNEGVIEMSKGTINKVIIIGRLGQNPELRYMPSGIAMTTISVATNDGYKDAKTGQFIEQTEWHRVAMFGKQAETLNQFVGKGDLIYIEGKLKTRKWQDKTTGQDRYSTDIVATDMQMLGSSDHQRHDEPMPDYIPAQLEVSGVDEKGEQDASIHEAKKSTKEAKAVKVKAKAPVPTLEEINAIDDDQPPF